MTKVEREIEKFELRLKKDCLRLRHELDMIRLEGVVSSILQLGLVITTGAVILSSIKIPDALPGLIEFLEKISD